MILRSIWPRVALAAAACRPVRIRQKLPWESA